VAAPTGRPATYMLDVLVRIRLLAEYTYPGHPARWWRKLVHLETKKAGSSRVMTLSETSVKRTGPSGC